MNEHFHKLDPNNIVDDDIMCGQCGHSVPDWHCLVPVLALGSEPERHERQCDLCRCRIDVTKEKLKDLRCLESVGDTQGPTNPLSIKKIQQLMHDHEPEFSIAVCLDCGPRLHQPFLSIAERDEWRGLHQEATGHKVSYDPAEWGTPSEVPSSNA